MKKRWTQELADFLRFCASERRLAPVTCSAYGRDVSACLDYLQGQGIRDLAEVRVTHLRGFLAEEQQRRPAVPSQARRRVMSRTPSCEGETEQAERRSQVEVVRFELGSTDARLRLIRRRGIRARRRSPPGRPRRGRPRGANGQATGHRAGGSAPGTTRVRPPHRRPRRSPRQAGTRAGADAVSPRSARGRRPPTHLTGGSRSG
jgi:Phage integrase, N-terminal SAM-like domain